MFGSDLDLESDDDDDYIQRQMVKSALTTLKAYAEAHLSVRKDTEVAALYERDGRSPEPGQPAWVPYKPDQSQVWPLILNHFSKIGLEEVKKFSDLSTTMIVFASLLNFL